MCQTITEESTFDLSVQLKDAENAALRDTARYIFDGPTKTAKITVMPNTHEIKVEDETKKGAQIKAEAKFRTIFGAEVPLKLVPIKIESSVNPSIGVDAEVEKDTSYTFTFIALRKGLTSTET